MTDTSDTTMPTTDEGSIANDISTLPGEQKIDSTPSAMPDAVSVPIKTSVTDSFSMTPTPAVEPETPIAEKVVEDEPILEDKVTTPTEPSITPMPVSSPEPVAPLVVTEADVKQDVSEHQKLAEEIEILTGEIQALEAKIERLSSSASSIAASTLQPPVSSSVLPPIIPPSVNETPKPLAPEPMKIAPAEAAAPTVKSEFEMPKPFDMPKSTAPAASGSNLSDIYPKKDPELTMPPASAFPPLPNMPDAAETAEHQSVLGVIGEIVGIIGIVLLVLMLLSPLFKETLEPTLWASIGTFGWLSSVIALIAGFVLSLFQSGKWGMKIFFLIMMIIAGLLYFGLSNPNSFLEPILGSLLSFYL